jgi:SH3-like domain-containing protein
MLRALAMAVMLALAAPAAVAQEGKKTPYWASISAGQALLRTGPGRNFPAIWLYRRADLPVKVVEVYPNWRKIQDPDGTTGWMLVNLLSDTRTGVVTGNEPRPMRKAPSIDADPLYLAEPGVVGRLSKCSGGWCRLDVKGKVGHISTDHIWGVDQGEEF